MGKVVGVHRYTKETDNEYRGRILTKLKNSSSTIEALKVNSANFYNSQENSKWKYSKDDWVIVENWIYINLLSVRGKLSHDFIFPDRDFYNWCTIQIFSPEDITPEYKELIETIKAAGIKVYYKHDLFPRTFLKVVDWHTTYRAHLLYFLELNRNNLNGNYSGILEYSGQYSGCKPLFLPENNNTYNAIKSLEFLKQISLSEKNGIILRLVDVYSFYQNGGYDTNIALLFHLSYIFKMRFTGILEDSFLTEFGYAVGWKTFNSRIPLTTLVSLFILDYKYKSFRMKLLESTIFTSTNLGIAYSLQDWWDELYTLEDVQEFYRDKSLEELDNVHSIHLYQAHGLEHRIL